MTKAKILVVDDELKIRTLIQMYLEKNEYDVYLAGCGSEALQMAREVTPNLVILDIMLPDMDGFEVCKRIRENQSLRKTPIIYLSSLNSPDSIITGLDAGGDDYITKPFDPNVLIAKVSATLRLMNQHKGGNQSFEFEYETFSHKEMEILHCIERGYTNREIAERFSLTEGTVRVYNSTIFQKLQVKNRTQAIVRAKEANML